MSKFSEKLKAARAAKAPSRTKGQSTIAKLTKAASTDGAPGHVRQLNGGEYSILRAAALCLGALPAESCSEEIEVSNRLKSFFKGEGFRPHYGHNSFLVPASTNLLPRRHDDGSEWPEMKQFATELRQKIAASQPKEVDHDEVAWVRRKAMGTLSDSVGGTLVPAPMLGELIDLQVQFEAFSQAGAKQIDLPPNGRIQFPKHTSGGTAYWVGEANAITESDMGTGDLDLQAKKLGILYRFNNELLRFASPNVEALARTDMAVQMGLKADRAMFDGTGGTQIKGLLTYDTQASWTQGSDKVIIHTATSTGTDGDTFEPQDVYKMRHKLPDPVQKKSLNWVFRTDHAQTIMSKRGDATMPGDERGPFVFEFARNPATGEPSGLYGAGLITSQNVPNNRSKGSASNLSLVLLGAFEDWLIARAGVVEFALNPWEGTGFAAVQTLLRGVEYIDAGPRHLASFTYCDDIVVTN